MEEIILTYKAYDGYIAYSKIFNVYGDGDTEEEAIADLKAVVDDIIAIHIERKREGEINGRYTKSIIK